MDEAPVGWRERRLEVVLLRERAVDVRRGPAAAPAQRVRKRVVEALIPRGELARCRAVVFPLEREDAELRRLLLVLRLAARAADGRRGRERDPRLLLFAMA